MTGNKANYFVTEQGEYIAPEKIENIYLRSPFIAQVFVYGNSLKVSLIIRTILFCETPILN